MQLRDKNRYGIFKANSNLGEIEFNLYIYGFGEAINTYKDGKEIDFSTYADEDDEDQWDETDKEIIIYLCGDELIIDKSTIIRIDKITSRVEVINPIAYDKNSKELNNWNLLKSKIEDLINNTEDSKQYEEIYKIMLDLEK